MQKMRAIDAAGVLHLLPMAECVRELDRALAESVGTPVRSFVGGVKAPEGKFHLKAALSAGTRPMFAAKLNANFPGNPERGRPTIQGLLVLFDATTGEPLATMDSAAVTAVRTAAATAVAARHLAHPGADTLAVVGCGAQALFHVQAIHLVRPLSRVRCHDTSPAVAHGLADRVRRELGIRVDACDSLPACTGDAAMVVTLTSSRTAFLRPEHVRADAFIGAVGVDSPDKSEIHPSLMRDAMVIVDDRGQCAEMGDLHHAIAAGAMAATDVAGTLAEVCAEPARFQGTGKRIVFDSTGIPLEDVVAARIVYDHASTVPPGGPLIQNA